MFGRLGARIRRKCFTRVVVSWYGIEGGSRHVYSSTTCIAKLKAYNISAKQSSICIPNSQWYCAAYYMHSCSSFRKSSTTYNNNVNSNSRKHRLLSLHKRTSRYGWNNSPAVDLRNSHINISVSQYWMSCMRCRYQFCHICVPALLRSMVSQRRTTKFRNYGLFLGRNKICLLNLLSFPHIDLQKYTIQPPRANCTKAMET